MRGKIVNNVVEEKFCPICNNEMEDRYSESLGIWYWWCDDCMAAFDEELSELFPTEESRSHSQIFGNDIPEGCVACGGPYPDCCSGCNMFDE